MHKYEDYTIAVVDIAMAQSERFYATPLQCLRGKGRKYARVTILMPGMPWIQMVTFLIGTKENVRY